MTDKQPEALRLADELEAEFPLMVNTATMLRTQHSALERKDALLRQAQDFMAGALFEDDENGNALYDTITKELAK